MTFADHTARAFRLDDEGWERHANPLSGWSRIVSGLPLIILAVWSRVWLGWWALIPIALVALWIWVNPRAFGPARSDRSWVSRAVFGERLWTRRAEFPVPAHHIPVCHLLLAISGAGGVLLIAGLIWLHPWLTATGAILAFGGKMWFLDRMVWLYDEVTAARPDLRYTGPGSLTSRPA